MTTRYPKRFYYCDESGQDSNGALFVVAVVTNEGDRAVLELAAVEHEKASGKGVGKWNGTSYHLRLDFVRRVLGDSLFRGALCFGFMRHIGTAEYDLNTAILISHSIRAKQAADHQPAVVFIDGMSKAKQPEYAKLLRRLGCHARVKRDTDHSDPLMRLADIMAGFVRDGLEDEDSDAGRLLVSAIRSGALTVTHRNGER